MYYKIKVNRNNLEIIDVVKRQKKDDGFLYLTKDEFSKLNPDAISNYKSFNLEGVKTEKQK